MSQRPLLSFAADALRLDDWQLLNVLGVFDDAGLRGAKGKRWWILPPLLRPARLAIRTVVAGIAAIVLILLVAAVLLFINLPDANAFNARVEQLFVANDTLTGNAEIKLLEILARRVGNRVFRYTCPLIGL